MAKHFYQTNKKGNIFLVILLLLLLLSIGFNLKYILDKYHNKFTDSASYVYSHRGASGEELEHTFKAYDLAIKYGSKNIEQDLVTSKDGTLYVSHDSSAKKITGINKKYSNMTDKEIDKLKATDDSSILKLQDVFNKYKKDVNYIIELNGQDKQTKLFIDIVKKNDMSKNIVVQAKHVDTLNDVNKVFPDMEKLLLVSSQADLADGIKQKNVDIISIHKKLLNKQNIELIHSKKKKVNVWTMNSTKEIKKAIKLNVDSYFTNYTAKAFVLEKEHR